MGSDGGAKNEIGRVIFTFDYLFSGLFLPALRMGSVRLKPRTTRRWTSGSAPFSTVDSGAVLRSYFGRNFWSASCSSEGSFCMLVKNIKKNRKELHHRAEAAGTRMFARTSS